MSLKQQRIEAQVWRQQTVQRLRAQQHLIECQVQSALAQAAVTWKQGDRENDKTARDAELRLQVLKRQQLDSQQAALAT